MFTARAATNRVVIAETAASASIIIFTRRRIAVSRSGDREFGPGAHLVGGLGVAAGGREVGEAE
jgi:hypothetical protein